MSEPNQTPPAQPTFQPPPGAPPPTLDEQVQACVDRYKEAGIDLSPREARHQVETLARIDQERVADPTRTRPDGTYARDFVASMSDAHKEAQFAQLQEENMRPAARPADYQIPRSPSAPDTPEVHAEEGALRAAMFDAQLPPWAGNAIAQSLYEDSGRFDGMTQEQLDDHRERTYMTLERLWGNDFKGRAERLERFMQAAAAKHPTLRGVAAAMDLNAVALNTLSQFVEHQARRR